MGSISNSEDLRQALRRFLCRSIVPTLLLFSCGQLLAQARRPQVVPTPGNLRLEGRIHTETGTALADYRVVVRHSTMDFERGVVTRPDGRFVLQGLAAGSYTLIAERFTFPRIELEDIQVGPGETDFLEIEVRVSDSTSTFRLIRPGSTAAGVSDERTERNPSSTLQRPPDPEPEPVPRVFPESVPPDYKAAGAVGKGRNRTEIPANPDFEPVTDRWRLGLPQWHRYPDTDNRNPITEGHWWDPYDQHVLKGDYPLLGNDWFLALTATSFSSFEYRKLPVVSNPTSQNPGSAQFFQ